MNFDISVVGLINIIFIAAGIGVCALCFLQVTSSVHFRKEVRRYFQVFFLLIILYIGTHLARQLMDGRGAGGVRIAISAVTFTEMLSAGLTACMISMLILFVTDPGKSKKALKIALLVLMACHALLITAGAFTDLIYYFDADNVYHRSPAYLLSNACPVAMLVIDIVLMIRHGRKISSRVRVAFWIYLIAPVIAVAIQSFSYGIQFIIFATVASVVYMFSVIVKDQNETYSKQQIESSRLETELTMASPIQADMVPNIFPAFPERGEFDIYASMNPAKEVGGDFYDFFLVDDDHLCMVIADVSGKGVPAALFMMASKIILANNAMLGKKPAQILTDTNASICSNNREEMFVTVWLGILELSTGKLTAANAGHEYPVLTDAEGRFGFVKDKHGLVIGGKEGIRYSEYELELKPGSKLFLYTDGVPEANNEKEELFGTDRLLRALNEKKDTSPEDILSRVRGAVDVFVNGTEQFDDLTMLCLEHKGKNNNTL